MPTQASGSTGQAGSGADPCASYQAINCGGQLPIRSNFNPLGYNPNAIRDASGCFQFAGCYVGYNGTYYAWAGYDLGYAVVNPTDAAQGTAPAPTPNQSIQVNGQTVYIPPVNAATAVDVTIPSQRADVSAIIVRAGQVRPALPTSIAPTGQLWYWYGPGTGWTLGVDPNYRAPVAGQNLPSNLPGEGPTAPYASNPTNPSQLPYNPALPGNLPGEGPTAPGAGVGGAAPLPGTDYRPNLDNIANALNANASAVNSYSQGLSAFMQEEGKQAADNTAVLGSALDNQLGVLTQAARDHLAALQEQTQTMVEAIRQGAPNPLIGQSADLSQAVANNTDALTTFKEELSTLLSNPSDFAHAVSQGLASGMLGPLGQSVDSRLQIYAHLFTMLMNGEFKSWADMEAALNQVSGANDFAFHLVDTLAIISVILRVGVVRAEPLINELTQLSLADNPNQILDIGSVQEIFKRSLWTDTDSKAELLKQGLNDDRSSLLLKLSEVFAPMGIIEEGVLRGTIAPEDGATWLSAQGFSIDTIKAIVSLYDKIPPPQDLTRIADKRVWGLNTDPKYGQYDELPQQYIDNMAKWGFSSDWTSALWAAHWNLPSPPQIFDMFHRGVINEEDIQTYLGLTDWLPFFRDGLLAISYNVPTRVDTRRALHAGIITDDQALAYHKAQGYTDADAAVLVELDKQTNTTDQASHLTRLQAKIQTFVESAYAKGNIDRSEATQHLIALGLDPGTAQLSLDVLDHERAIAGVGTKVQTHTQQAINMVLHAFGKGSLGHDDAANYLAQLGYSLNEANTELNIQEIERQAALKQKWADAAVKLYGEHTIEYPEFQSMLQGQNFNGTEIAQLSQEAEMARVLRTKKPTEADYAKAVKKANMSQADFHTGLAGLGYTDDAIALLYKLAQI